MDNHIFRGAALGFNRQDVMEYIEKVQKEAETKTAWLNAELEAARREGGDARQALEDCTQERDRLSAELEERKEQYETELAEQKERYEAELAEQKERSETGLKDLRERYEAETDARAEAELEAEQQRDRLQTLETENGQLAKQVRDLEGRMADLRREKERLTQLELDAHSRAEELLAQAQAQADGIIAQADARAGDIQAQARMEADVLLAETRKRVGASVEKCGELLRSCETVAAHVSGELRKMDVAVAQLPVGMDHLKKGLAELLNPEEAES